MYWAFTYGVCGVNWVTPPPASGFARFLRLGSGRRAGGRLRITLFTRQMWQFFGAPDFVSELVMFTFLGPSGRVHVLRCLTVRKSCSQSKKMLNTFEREVKYECVNTVVHFLSELWSRLKLSKYRVTRLWREYSTNLLFVLCKKSCCAVSKTISL